MKTWLKVLLGLLLAIVVVGASGFAWARSATAAKLARTIEVHQVDFPVPWPLSEAELEELRAALAKKKAQEQAAAAADAAEAEVEQDAQPEAAAEAADGEEAEAEVEAAAATPPEPVDPLAGVNVGALAHARAVLRGKHLVQARYACIECHGKDFSGGVMVDDPALGMLLGPNITSGKGGKTKDYSVADWDRIVRHGIKPDGKPAAMPSEDFQLMSDQELSDIIAYLRTVPPVDNEVAPVSLGPLGTFLMATGELPLSADVIGDHGKAHVELPPSTAPTAEFGKHLAGVCTGCHRPGLEGGPMAVGPPDWPPAMNLTPHAEGLAGWSYEQFRKTMLEGVRPDGTTLREPMSLMMPYAKNMKEVELEALWAYLGSLPAKPTGK